MWHLDKASVDTFITTIEEEEYWYSPALGIRVKSRRVLHTTGVRAIRSLSTFHYPLREYCDNLDRVEEIFRWYILDPIL